VSAIFGILRFDGAAVNPRDLERMSNTLAHRGPDGRKFSVDGAIGLGHCLLRVNDEDRFEAQPLHDGDLTLVADARIDNREELATVFGWTADECGEKPDSAFILEACRRWGESAPEHLLGDFAYAVWDARAKKLTLARDHMGQRSVLYHHGQSFIAFASSEKALWAVADVPRSLSMRNFTRVVVQDIGHDPGSTLFEGIRGVCGGATLTVDANGHETQRRYWQPHAGPEHVGRGLDHYVAAYRRVLGEAVACRVRRTAQPAALFFSGGFDSAAIAGLAGPIVRAQKRKLLAIVSGMPEGHSFADEGGRPQVAWCRRDMPHLDIRTVEPDMNVLTEGLPAALADVGHPLNLSKLLDIDLHRQAASAGVRLVMDGHGGDYTVNPTGNATLVHFLKTGQLCRFAAEFGAWRRHRRRSFLRATIFDVVLAAAAPRLRRALRAWRTQEQVDGLATPLTGEVLQEALSDGAQPRAPLKRLRRADKAGRSAIVLRTIQGAALSPASHIPSDCALDFTRPFHDKRVVELALAIPEDFDLIDGRARALARRALAGIYPAEFARIEKGYDTTAPMLGRMVQAKLPEIAAELERLERDPRLASYFDFPAIRRRLEREARRKVRRGQSASLTARAYLIARYLEWFRRENR